MGLRINTNIQSLVSQRNLSNTHDKQSSSLEKLASGSRINRSADDAAGLAIASKLNANLRSMRQAIRNTHDGVSLIQTAEGALNEVGNILIRLRELSIQSANDTLSDVERGFINREVQQLSTQVDVISQNTEFNGKFLLRGDPGPSDKTPMQFEIQVGIRADPFLDRIRIPAEALNMSQERLGIDGISVATKVLAQDNISRIDGAISHLNEERSKMGAMQNRLQSAIQNLTIYSENTASSLSRIKDLDIAEETAEMTKNNILASTGISVLAQANQNSQQVLKLMG